MARKLRPLAEEWRPFAEDKEAGLTLEPDGLGKRAVSS